MKTKFRTLKQRKIITNRQNKNFQEFSVVYNGICLKTLGLLLWLLEKLIITCIWNSPQTPAMFNFFYSPVLINYWLQQSKVKSSQMFTLPEEIQNLSELTLYPNLIHLSAILEPNPILFSKMKLFHVFLWLMMSMVNKICDIWVFKKNKKEGQIIRYTLK